MEKEYELVYRCRMCGDVIGEFFGSLESTRTVHTALQMKEYAGSEITGGFVICRHDTHSHEDGSEGFTDYIGYRERIKP